MALETNPKYVSEQDCACPNPSSADVKPHATPEQSANKTTLAGVQIVNQP